MPPQLALILCLAFILLCFALDVRGRPRVSSALWIPVIWVSVTASRPISYWLNTGGSVDLTEGSPAERLIFSSLIGLAVLVLLSRRLRWGELLWANKLLVLFLIYAFLSIIWSDFPYVSLKRYVKTIGLCVMALMVLTEESATDAIKTVVRRSSYLLVPLSVLLIKYYPAVGTKHASWSGAKLIVGIAGTKNMLGQICLVLGIGLVWILLSELRAGHTWKSHRTRFLIDLSMLAVTIQTLLLADSKTSLVCLLVGISVLFAARSPFFRSKLGLIVVSGIASYAVLEWLVDITATLTGLLGRDPTLTNRTIIWGELLAFGTNLWIGTGHESFWLGERLQVILMERHINEAHNGYLEIVLNLGIFGLTLLLLVLTRSYWHLKDLVKRGVDYGPFLMAVLMTLLVYNVAESGFKGLGLVSFAFFLVVIDAQRLRHPEAVRPARVTRAGPRLDRRLGDRMSYRRPWRSA